MLIPNKFNGYQSDGRRTYPIGGGVGEAMLLGAAMGGGSAALTGGDPLKGALLGGITGGIGGGISSALPAASSTAQLAAPITESVGRTAAQIATEQAGLQGATQAGALSGANAVDFAPMSAINPQITPVYGIDPLMGMSTNADYVGNLSSAIGGTPPPPGGTFMEGVERFARSPWQSIKGSPWIAGAAGLAGAYGGRRDVEVPGSDYESVLKRFRYSPDRYRPTFLAAEGGIASLAAGGYDRMVGEQPQYAQQMARGGISSLGSYSDGGRMLRGPGDGMSDSIPGVIANKRPARLADGEFVIPADVVSHLGNGSTDAGARQLYAMMNKVRRARTGRKQQGRQINPRKLMPA